MENRYWRWVGMFLICLVAFGIGYGYGFVKGGAQTFDFFMGFVAYSVDNGIINIEINSDELRNYLELAKKYCWSNQGAGSLSVDCNGKTSNIKIPTPRETCEKLGIYEWSPLDAGYCYFPNGTIASMNYAGGFE